MDDDRKVIEPHLAKDEVPPEGSASGVWFVIIGFTLAAVFATIALWPLESDLLATQLPLVLGQLLIAAVVWFGLLWLVYSGFMDRHIAGSMVLGVVLFAGGWGLQELVARLMGVDNPSFIAIAVGSWLGVLAFYGWWAATGRLKAEKLHPQDQRLRLKVIPVLCMSFLRSTASSSKPRPTSSCLSYISASS